MKKNNSETGVYLGRFSPFHKGHESVLEALISDFGGKSLIQIGSSNRLNERTPFTFIQRKKLIQTLYPEVEIMPLPDVASHLGELHQTAERWLDQIFEEEAKRKTRFVFYGGSDEDLQFVGRRFKIKKVCRTQIKISGTQIREALRAKNDKILRAFVDEKIIDLVEKYFQIQSSQILESFGGEQAEKSKEY